MPPEIAALAEKILASRAGKGYWRAKAVDEAAAWCQNKAKELKAQWVSAWKAEIEAKSIEIYAARGLSDRGQKA